MEISWDLHIAHQDDKELLVGVAPVIEIDSVCSVPHFPDQAIEAGASILLAQWALDDNAGLKEWQRRPDVRRIQAIPGTHKMLILEGVSTICRVFHMAIGSVVR